MPYFSVLVEGSGFKIPSSSGQPLVTGFAVSRVVRAREASAASALALSVVAAEWNSGHLSRFKVTPAITASDVNRMTLLSGLFSRPAGYVFYPG